jgi:hypothetical protein
MNPHENAVFANQPPDQATDVTIPQLVGQVYEAAPPVERCRMLEHLMRPLGVLSLVVVANGVFAKIWFQRGWQDLQIKLEDTQIVRASDVMALVDHAQQVCVEAVDGLAQMVAVSPVMAGSAAAALLVAALVKRARSRRAGTAGAEDCGSATP